MDLASRVIQANEDEVEREVIRKKRGDGAPEGYYTDDLGFWVEQDIRRKDVRYAEYILFRCQYLNDNLNTRGSEFLYAGNRLIFPTSNNIADLADLPGKLPPSIVIWVHKRLCQYSPRLNESKIEIKPGLLWDIENGRFVKKDKKDYKTI